MPKTQGGGLAMALGGGTARAMAHVGVLEAFEEHGLPPTAVAGTSFGAIVAAVYALQLGREETRRVLLAPDSREVWSQALDFGLHQCSLIGGRRLERWLDRRIFHGATFADVKIPLVIAVTSLQDGELRLVTSGTLARACVASCALPLLLPPVRYDDDYVVDGGFVEAVPFTAGLSLGQPALVGVHTGIDAEKARMVRTLRTARERRVWRRLNEYSVTRSLRNPFGRTLRGLGWAARSYARPQLVPEGARLMSVNPGIAWWDFHRTADALELGLARARELLDQGFAAGLEAPETPEALVAET